MYVEELIGPMTVNTMPEETIQAFQDHGKAALTLEQGIDEAEKVFADLAQAGIDYDDVTETLEREGVEKFADSFAELLEGIRVEVGRARPGVDPWPRSRPPSSSSASGPATPRSGPAGTRTAGLAGSTSR